MTEQFNILTLSNNTETILSEVFSTLCLVKVPQLHKKYIGFQSNIILGILFLPLLFFRAIKLPVDKADIENIALVSPSFNVCISKYKNHNWNYWNQYYLTPKIAMEEIRQDVKLWKYSLFLTCCLSVLQKSLSNHTQELFAKLPDSMIQNCTRGYFNYLAAQRIMLQCKHFAWCCFNWLQ